MDVLDRGFDPGRPAQGPVIPFSLRVLVPAAAVGGLAVAVGRLGGSFAPASRALGVLGFHGGFLAASLEAAWDGRRGWERPAALVGLALLIAGGGCTAAPAGCVAYLLPPVMVGWVVLRHRECGRLGLAPVLNWRAVGLGAAVGGCLGAHLLLSAARTVAYAAQVGPPTSYLTDVLYDLGANALSADCFFRGTLFNRWQRRWGFWPGALAATGLSVVRYLLDPALPGVSALLVGAVFYLGLLSLAGCALLWRFGSLLPSLAASFVFFSAYRLLSVW